MVADRIVHKAEVGKRVAENLETVAERIVGIESRERAAVK